MFIKYMKTHIKSLILFAVFAVTMLTVMIVFEADLRPVFYGLVLCAFLGGLLAAWDYSRYREKHELLSFVEKEITDTIDHLPLPRDLIEEDYTNIIRSSFDDKMKLAFETSRGYEEMKEYYTIWAHQIKTPIAALRLILQTEPDSPAMREISDELFKIEQYVEMVLCYLRLDGGSDYVIKTCSLDDIIKQSVRKYASQFIRTKNRLIYEGTDAEVVTDEKWLGFIIEQVLSNALKYTDGGQVSIGVKSIDDKISPDKGQRTVLSISDTGIGIASEDLPRIFEKGYTGYNGRADKKSTGIGLYLCRRIAENLGCSISAQSVCGAGTTIKITLAP